MHQLPIATSLCNNKLIYVKDNKLIIKQVVQAGMFWKRHQSIYGSSNKKYQNITNNHNNTNNQLVKNRNALAPIMSAAQHQTIQPNSNVKFTIRKPSRSKQSKLSNHIPGTFFMHRGNNHQIVKTALEQLGFTQNICKQQCCLIWYQGKDIPKKDFLKSQINPRATNYLHNHSQITNKQKLFQNLSRYDPSCVGAYIPKTFIVDFKDNIPKIQSNLTEFLTEYFKKLGVSKSSKKNSSLFISNYYGQICIPFSRILRNVSQSKRNQNINQNQSGDDQAKQNQTPLWIVKPSFLNRGQGIQVISNLRQLQNMLSEDSQQISIRMYQSQQKNTPSSFVIQEYIMDPLLYLGYKFDIRVWVLLRNSKHNGLQTYIYKQAYTRLAGHKYKVNQGNNKQQQAYTLTDPDTGQKKGKSLSKSIQYISSNKANKHTKNEINNKFVHLTNNAVQKHCKQYGALYQGNQLLVSELVQKLGIPKLTQTYLFQNFISITKKLIGSAQQKLASKSCYGSFQLIGLDFMIDSKLNTWLIQANCNPCLQESSSILKSIIPVMLNELFQVVNINRIMGHKSQRSQSNNQNATQKQKEKQKTTNWQRIV